MQEYRIEFRDGSSTLLIVMPDESVQEAVVALCEREGWSVQEVTAIVLVGEAGA